MIYCSLNRIFLTYSINVRFSSNGTILKIQFTIKTKSVHTLLGLLLNAHQCIHFQAYCSMHISAYTPRPTAQCTSVHTLIVHTLLGLLLNAHQCIHFQAYCSMHISAYTPCQAYCSTCSLIQEIFSSIKKILLLENLIKLSSILVYKVINDTYLLNDFLPHRDAKYQIQLRNNGGLRMALYAIHSTDLSIPELASQAAHHHSVLLRTKSDSLISF